jgi:hypothetical protein
MVFIENIFFIIIISAAFTQCAAFLIIQQLSVMAHIYE